MRKNRKPIKATNAIEPATSSVKWGKRTKRYPGVAGKGGNTTNYEIPAWMFDRELEELENGGALDA